jgi:hypothetical protein
MLDVGRMSCKRKKAVCVQCVRLILHPTSRVDVLERRAPVGFLVSKSIESIGQEDYLATTSFSEMRS